MIPNIKIKHKDNGEYEADIFYGIGLKVTADTTSGEGDDIPTDIVLEGAGYGANLNVTINRGNGLKSAAIFNIDEYGKLEIHAHGGFERDCLLEAFRFIVRALEDKRG